MTAFDTPPSSAPDQHRLEHDRLLARGALVILLFPMLWFVRTDLRMFSEGLAVADRRMMVRSAMFLWIVSGIWRLGKGISRDTFERTLLVQLWGVGAFHVALSLMRPTPADLPMRSALLVLAVMYVMPIGGWRQAGAAITTSVALMAIRQFRLNVEKPYDVLGDLVIIAAFNALGLFLMRRRAILEVAESRAWEAEREARDAAEKALGELKTLRGIIPICAHCKHVRTEAGAWQQVEDYIVSRTDADFSHGICPSCLDQHYPEEEAPATA